MSCIFVKIPDPKCSVCMDTMKIQCLLNKPYHKVTEQAKKELPMLLAENVLSESRRE